MFSRASLQNLASSSLLKASDSWFLFPNTCRANSLLLFTMLLVTIRCKRYMQFRQLDDELLIICTTDWFRCLAYRFWWNPVPRCQMSNLCHTVPQILNLLWLLHQSKNLTLLLWIPLSSLQKADTVKSCCNQLLSKTPTILCNRFWIPCQSECDDNVSTFYFAEDCICVLVFSYTIFGWKLYLEL